MVWQVHNLMFRNKRRLPKSSLEMDCKQSSDSFTSFFTCPWSSQCMQVTLVIGYCNSFITCKYLHHITSTGLGLVIWSNLGPARSMESSYDWFFWNLKSCNLWCRSITSTLWPTSHHGTSLMDSVESSKKPSQHLKLEFQGLIGTRSTVRMVGSIFTNETTQVCAWTKWCLYDLWEQDSCLAILIHVTWESRGLTLAPFFAKRSVFCHWSIPLMGSCSHLSYKSKNQVQTSLGKP